MATKVAQFRRAGVGTLALCCVAALYPANQARSATIEYTFGGTVTSIQNGQSLDAPWDQVAVGDAWQITYHFNDATADSFPGPEIGDYYHAVSYFDLTIGTANASGNVAPQTGSNLRTYNGAVSPFYPDMYEARIPFDNYQYEWFMQLANGTRTAWDKADFVSRGNPRDSLPSCMSDRQVTPIPGVLSTWFESRGFTFQESFPGSGGEIGGSVDWHTYVPEPDTLALVALGALGFLGRRRP